MRIGVIVTTYNNSDSILRCLNSVKYFKNKLTKYDIRIILVDDASVDNTPKLLLEFTKTIPSTIFKKYNKNGGVSRSRNYGISKSLDMDYLLFVDGDDELDSKLSNCLSTKKLVNDFYTFDFSIGGNKKNTLCNHLETGRIFNDKSISDYLFSYLIRPNRKSMFISCWAKLYKTKLLKTNVNLRFKEKMKIYEDLYFVLRFMRKCKTIEYIKVPSYIYRNKTKLKDRASMGCNWNVLQLFSFVSALRHLRFYLIEKKQNIDHVNLKIFHCIAVYTCISSARAWIRVHSFSEYIKMFYQLKKVYKKPIIEKSLKIYNVDKANGNKLITFYLKKKLFFMASILTFIHSRKRYK